MKTKTPIPMWLDNMLCGICIAIIGGLVGYAIGLNNGDSCEPTPEPEYRTTVYDHQAGENLTLTRIVLD